jgi:hypothetical protein
MSQTFTPNPASAPGASPLPACAAPHQGQRGVTFRAVLLGLLLIPPNTYWIIYVEGIRHWNHCTAMSLFWNSIFCIFLLVLLNLFLKRYLPTARVWGRHRPGGEPAGPWRWGWHLAPVPFSQGEFITIYVMITLASALAGHDSLQLGYPVMYMQFLSESLAKGRIDARQYYPEHLTVRRDEIIKPLEWGGGSLYRAEYIEAWVGPVLWWSCFIAALGLVMICLNVLIRKQWTENEKLSYPIVQLPLAMTHDGGTWEFFRHKPLWFGFLVGAGVDIFNGLHFYYPFVPGIVVRHDAPELNLGQQFSTFPWTAIPRTLGMPLYPFLIGLGYFLPLDLSFSIWFFFLLKLLMLVVSAAAGFQPGQPKNPPFLNEQSWGAWGAIFFYVMWISRPHLTRVFRTAFNLGRGEDDSREPMSYRSALLGIVVGCAFIYWFCLQAKMTPGIIFGFFLIYFVLSIAITRVRAELGPPAHEMAGNMNAATLLYWIFGTNGLGAQNMTMMTMFWWFTGRGYRTHPMPCQLEAFKMGQVGRVDMRGLGWAMLLAMFFGGLATYWACLHWEYIYGANIMTAHNRGTFGLLRGRLDNPQGTDYVSLQAVGLGAVVTAGMIVARLRLPWWPFHPAGYAMAMNFGIEYFWTCLMISTVLKWAILRYGGHRMNRQAMPFMFGLILGEFNVGAFWSVMSVVTGMRTYDFAPG